jgi:hypothetical protein
MSSQRPEPKVTRNTQNRGCYGPGSGDQHIIFHLAVRSIEGCPGEMHPHVESKSASGQVMTGLMEKNEGRKSHEGEKNGTR